MSRFDPGKPWNGHAAAYTFTSDDGRAINNDWRDTMVAAGARFTAFLNSGFVDTADHVTTAEAKQLADDGIEIGGHTINHYHLPTLNDADLQTEIVDDQSALEDLVQRPVRSFAYPYHEHGMREIGKVAQYYDAARNGATGGVSLVGPQEPHEWALFRNAVNRYSIPMRTQSSELTGASLSYNEAQTRAAVQTKAAYWITHNLWEIHLAHLSTEMDTTHLAWILDELKDLDIWIAPFGEVVRWWDVWHRRT